LNLQSASTETLDVECADIERRPKLSVDAFKRFVKKYFWEGRMKS
jgi:hypothetical protein